MSQLAESTACVRFHQIGPRLARWLLMSQDRSQTSSFDVTQEFLAYMLGVRRVGVTTAAGTLQRNGLISYSRGKLTVLNRKGLEPVGLSGHRLQSDRSDLFFTVFLTNSRAIGLQIRQKLSSPGSNFASMPIVRQAPRARRMRLLCG